MKIAAIGDIHGRKIWREIAEDAIKKVDKLVFLGDYIDPYPIEDTFENNKIKKWNTFINEYKSEEELSDKEYLKKYYGINWNDKSDKKILKNLDWEEGDEELSDEEYYKKYYGVDIDDDLDDEPYKKRKIKLIYPSFEDIKKTFEEIIDFKKKNMDKVVLIIGNHDAHYLYDEIQPCTRYDRINGYIFQELYKQHKNLFQYAYQYKNKLFTHAGVSNSWVDFFDETLISFGLKPDNSNIGEVINKMGEHKLSNKIINAAGKSRGGLSLYGGPTWAHITETDRDYLINFDQFVGHSMVNYIHTEKIPRIPGSITYCDVLDNPNKNINYNYHIVNA